MKFSAQEEYGLRCLIAIGRTGENGSITVAEISKAEGLTIPNVAKLVNFLRRDGFVKSTRGQSGGYALASPAAEIKIKDVLAALGGRLYDDQFCDRHSGYLETCIHDSTCSVRSLWNRLQRAVDDVLERVTLADLLPPEASPKSRDALTPMTMIKQ
jgi:Rrf2 family protein